jgi:hypothetical protein
MPSHRQRVGEIDAKPLDESKTLGKLTLPCWERRSGAKRKEVNGLVKQPVVYRSAELIASTPIGRWQISRRQNPPDI